MEDVSEQLDRIYGGRKWILAVGAAASALRMHDQLSDWGCETLVVAAVAGVGEVPDTEIVYTGAQGPTIVEGIRAFFESVEHPTDEVMAAVDRFDPDRNASVIAEPYATATRMVGRPTFGVRKPEWSAWEDKMRVDALWEDLSIEHAPYRIVDVASAPEAAASLETDLGTVWSADNSQGWHGGGDFVRWVRDRNEYQHQVEWFDQRAQLVRVMPFLDGLPCSIHGWVTNSGVATFLPVEILILRDHDEPGFGYAGVATTWSADAGTTKAMRDVALRVGKYLRASDGYRGPFGVDGILTDSGFRPTELNPRMSAGAGTQMRDLPIPLGFAMRAEAEDLVHLDHAAIEQSVVDGRTPHVHFGKPISNPDLKDEEMFIRGGVGGEPITETETEDDSIGRISLGPAANGKYLLGAINADQLPAGDPAGPFVAKAINYVNVRWNLALPTYVGASLLALDQGG